LFGGFFPGCAFSLRFGWDFRYQLICGGE